jgi:hypothetical protein
MKHIRSGVAGRALIAVLTAALPAYVLAGTAESACGKWTVVESPNGPSNNNHLYGVSSSAANNVWVVGSYESTNFGPFRTLTERWNGRAWSVLPSVDPGSGDDDLYSVAVVSPTDVWAVGKFDPQTTSQDKTLIEHWNGQKWTVMPNPSPGQLSDLFGVGAVSANDIWAAGFFYNEAGNSQTLIEHWDGRKWSVVPSPSPGSTDNALGGLAVVSASEIWVIGSQSSDAGNSSQTLIERWDGKNWSVVPSPNPGSPYNNLQAVTAISTSDAWAVGGQSGNNFVNQTLAEHWDGHSWTVVPTQDVGSGGNGLSGVSAFSGTDVWAVGSYSNSAGLSKTLAERWDGARWRVGSTRNPSKEFNQLVSITEVTNALWSVGYFGTSKVANTLVESLCQ